MGKKIQVNPDKRSSQEFFNMKKRKNEQFRKVIDGS
jgi:hypothetical protein